MFQPRDLAELLGLQRLRCCIDKAMQFLGPGVYRFVGFFLLSAVGAVSTVASSKLAICRNRA